MMLHSTALVHDWLVTRAGAEKVLEAIYEEYPGDIFTLVHDPKQFVQSSLSGADVSTSFIQNLPFGKSKYRSYLPLFPLAIEKFDLSEYEVVLSTSHAVAKGVLTTANQLHICYCCTPVRYAWDLTHQYQREAGLTKGVKGNLARLVLHYIRMWDLAATNRVDAFITLSDYIARRIKKVYNRESTVIYPPVDVQGFSLCTNKDEYYLTASRFVPYKKIDLIVEAFAALPDKKLIVVGDGPDAAKIRSKAAKNVELVGAVPHNELVKLMQHAKAFVFAAEEDFGIVPVEAQACGTPVIAYGKGGACETVIEGKTGLFFSKQSVAEIHRAIDIFEHNYDAFDPVVCRHNAERFNAERFKREFCAFVEAQKSAFFRK